MLVTIETTAQQEKFPLMALDELDKTMMSLGYRKEFRSVIVPGKSYATSYEGPDSEIGELESKVSDVTRRFGVQANVALEDSVRFP